MSKRSRSRAAAKATTSAQASATSPAPSSPRPNIFPDCRGTLLLGGVIVLAALAVYHNSFSGPFIYDDPDSITKNPTIRHLWPIWSALSPPPGQTVSGRPLLNLSLALNYAISGNAVWSYHALNLAIHILACLTLFGLVRRTLLQPGLRGRFGPAALPLALAVALLWTAHPLQTESVTYIIQRAESLMGLFYLLTLYCFVRSTDETGERRQEPGNKYQVTSIKCQETDGQGSEKRSLPNSAFSFQPSPSVVASPALQSPGKVGAKTEAFWLSASLLCCLLGMAAKEVMVSAPVMVLLYDRTFVAGTFREAWRLRWRYYLGLACTWLLLGCLVIATGQRGGTAGFGGSLPAWDYALTQFQAIAQYLRLSVWPQPLVFDYGRPVLHTIAEAAPYAAIVVPLVTLTAFGLWRNHALGFLGAWFFAILAPSSSVVPVITETMAEHRMYLALAAVVAVLVFGLYTLFGRRGVTISLTLSVIFGVLTARRNEDYRSELSIWSDTVAKCPDNPWAYLSKGHALLLLGRFTEAREQFETALRIKPDLAEAYQNLGVILDQEGRIGEAINDYTQAIRLASNLVNAHYNLAVDLQRMGQLTAAIDQYREVVRATPDDFLAQCGLGSTLVQQGHLAEAHAQFEETVRIFPESAEARYNLGNILVQLGRLPEAAQQYELALQYKPDFPAARKNLELTRKTMVQSAAGSEK